MLHNVLLLVGCNLFGSGRFAGLHLRLMFDFLYLTDSSICRRILAMMCP